jgi:hypothetical protein
MDSYVRGAKKIRGPEITRKSEIIKGDDASS